MTYNSEVKRDCMGGVSMNHDYVHCLDYTEDCPEECFRAVLNRDLQKINPVKLIAVHLAWGFLKGTDECLITRKENEEEEKHEQN